MGYESKVTLVWVPDYKVNGQDHPAYAKKIMTLDLNKMGYDIGWKDVFDKSMSDNKFTYYLDTIPDDEENEDKYEITGNTKDPYGYSYTYANIERVREWANRPKTVEYYTYSNGHVYTEYNMLRSLLDIAVTGYKPETLFLVHQGY